MRNAFNFSSQYHYSDLWLPNSAWRHSFCQLPKGCQNSFSFHKCDTPSRLCIKPAFEECFCFTLFLISKAILPRHWSQHLSEMKQKLNQIPLEIQIFLLITCKQNCLGYNSTQHFAFQGFILVYSKKSVWLIRYHYFHWVHSSCNTWKICVFS